MKKVVNSVLASALALTVAPMAFAAEDATTTTAPKMDANTEKMVKRLEALGLVAGYGNGDYGVEKTITRAEFATLIVRARGLEQGSKLAQYNSTYTDVKTGDWFAGYVNVASGEEIVKGFPDKSFKPQNQVTYAEAVTMVVRALGYEPSVKGVWPNSMIAKASELNIAKGINNPNNAALRGDVFKMIDNALRVKLMEQKAFGTDISFEATDKTLLTKYLKITVRDMDWTHESGNDSDDLPLVTNVPAIGLGKLKANEVTLSGKDAGLGNTTYKVADGINPNEFDGQKVQVWIKDDNQNTIVYMEGSEDEEVVMDRVSTFLLKGKDTVKASDLTRSDLEDLKLELDASGKSYRLTKDTKVTYNFTRFNDPVDGLKAIINDNLTFGVKVVLNSSNEIAYIHVIDDQTIDKSKPGIKYGSKVISKVDADKKRITNLDNTKFTELDKQDEGKDFIVFIDGKPAKFSDLKEQDVYSVYYADGDKDKFLVYATRATAAGKVEKVVSRNKDEIRVTVQGKTYRVFDNASYSEDANKTIKKIDSSNRDLITNLDGEEVKLLLDASGRIRHIETKDAIDDRKPKAIVTRQVMENSSKDTWDFTVLTSKGKKETISLDAKYIYDKDGVNYDKNNHKNELRDILTPKKDGTTALLELSYNSKGEVDKVRILDRKLKHANSSQWLDLADKDDNAVGDYEVTDKTAIFKMTGVIEPGNRAELKNASTVKFKTIADQKKLDVYYSVDEDKAEVEAIFVVEGSGLGGDVHYGMVKEYGSSNKQDTITLVTKEKDGDAVSEKTYKLDDDKDELERYRDIRRGDFIAFNLSGDNEVEVDSVVEVVDGPGPSKITNKAYPKVLTKDKLDTASIDKLAVARIDKVDGNTLTFEPEEGAKQTFLTKSSTAYIDIFDDLEGKDGVDEGSYVVLIDTADTSGTRIDYVLIVADEDYIDKNDITKTALNNFLNQKTGDDTPDTWIPINKEITGKKQAMGGDIVAYRVIADLKSGVSEKDIDSVKLYVDDKLVDAEDYDLFIEDGKVQVDYITPADFTKAKLVLENSKGEKFTANVTYAKNS